MNCRFAGGEVFELDFEAILVEWPRSDKIQRCKFLKEGVRGRKKISSPAKPKRKFALHRHMQYNVT